MGYNIGSMLLCFPGNGMCALYLPTLGLNIICSINILSLLLFDDAHYCNGQHIVAWDNVRGTC